MNNNSYANFPHSYNFVPDPYAKNSQASQNAFSGATKGNKFKVLDYEVFIVEFVSDKEIIMIR